MIEGTEGARGPFWSPDSQTIGFGTKSELRTIAPQGRSPDTVCELPGGYGGGTWSPDGDSIVFATYRGPLYKVAARGGEPEILFEPEPSRGFLTVSPHFLPTASGSRRLVFSQGNLTSMQIVVRDLETNEEQSLVTGAAPVYSTSGHILYRASKKSGLWALPFSLKTLQAEKEFPIAQNAGAASVALDGTLIYGDFFSEKQLVWLDREGNVLGKIGEPQADMKQPALSPDERLVAVTGEEDGNVDIWIHEVDRAARTRLTLSDNTDLYPNWLPTGERITFASRPKPTREKAAGQQILYDGYPVDSGNPNILWFWDFLGFCNRVNNHLVSRGIHGHRLLDEPIEEFASAFGFAAVETKGELVQVVVQMFVAHGALMGAQQPALEQ